MADNNSSASANSNDKLKVGPTSDIFNLNNTTVSTNSGDAYSGIHPVNPVIQQGSGLANSSSSNGLSKIQESFIASLAKSQADANDSKAFSSAFSSAFASAEKANKSSNASNYGSTIPGITSNNGTTNQTGFTPYLVNGNQNVYTNGTSYDLDSAASALASGSGVASTTTVSGVTSNILTTGSNNGSSASSATSDGLYNIDVIVPTTSNVDKNAQGSADAQHLTDVETRDKANLVRDLKKAGLTQEQGKNITDKIEKAATKDAKNNNKVIIDAQNGNFNYHQDLIMNNKKIDPTLQKQIQKDQAMLYNHEMENKENMINNYRQAGLSQENINQKIDGIDKSTSSQYGLSTGKGQSKVFNTVSTDTIESEEQANGLSNNNVGRFLAEQKLKDKQAPTASANNNPLDSALSSANNQSLIQQFNQMFALDVKNGTATQKDAQMYNILNNKNGQNVSTTLSKYQADNNRMSNAAQKQSQNTATSGKSNGLFPSNDPSFE